MVFAETQYLSDLKHITGEKPTVEETNVSVGH